MAYGNNQGLRGMVEDLLERVERLEGGRGRDDFDDEDDFDEDHFGEDEDSLEEPSRFDEPSDSRTAGRPGGRLGSGHVRDANVAFRRYSRATAGGGIFGEDIARFAAGENINASSPIDRGRVAVSRFSRWR
jgi:hypothetical protein